MSQFKEFWIYEDHNYLLEVCRYKIEKSSEREIHVVEIAALEAAQKEIERLKTQRAILRCGQCGNEGLFPMGAKYKDEIEKLTAALKVAEDALNKYKDSAFDIDGKVYKVGSKAKEALAEIQKIQKGLG